MKVLIAEDQPMILKTLAFRMKKAGYEVIAAIDGQQAMELFESEKPDYGHHRPLHALLHRL